MSEQGENGISWTDVTWNPIRGCSRVSPGCVNCYAERQAYRFSGPGQPYEGLVTITNGHPQWTGRVRLIEKHLLDPLNWRKPRKVFVNSMSDLFHGMLPVKAIHEVFAVMSQTPEHTYQILTKRAHWMRNVLNEHHIEDLIDDAGQDFGWCHANIQGRWPLPNVWLGVSVENQQYADARIPPLLETPAAIRWISYEPALGPIDIRPYLATGALHWVVAGGESGPGARPAHPDWFRSVRDQCLEYGVAFHFKQHGAWREVIDGDVYATELGRTGKPPAFIVSGDGTVHCFRDPEIIDGVTMIRVGKGAAGRLLNGRTWDEYPEVRHGK